MYYNNFLGNSVSALGFGAMRLPVKNGKVDIEKTEAMIEMAYCNGINYYDTAYKYLDGESERILGRILERYPRDSWYLATKMPGHMMVKHDGKMTFRGYMSKEGFKSVEQIFEEQLEKCRVDYFDYYLLHNVNDISYSLYTDEELDIIGYLCQQKELGRIKHLGFSTHGNIETIRTFLQKYHCFEFVQIQLNYYDYFQNNADELYELLKKSSMPIVVMEPCRGGRLANLNQKQRKLLGGNESDASWAFKFLQGLDGLSVILSGMSEVQQLKDNLQIFNQRHDLEDSSLNKLMEVSESLRGLVLCTGCSYCCDSCPAHIPIPEMMEFYNNYRGNEKLFSIAEVEIARKRIQNCRHCHLCEKACPQKIPVLSVFDALKVNL